MMREIPNKEHINANTCLLEHSLVINIAKQWHQCLFIVIVMQILT